MYLYGGGLRALRGVGGGGKEDSSSVDLRGVMRRCRG